MKADPRTEAEVMHVLSRIVETASSRDVDGAMALFADDPNVFLLGTGVEASGGEILASALLRELTESAGDIRFDAGRDVVLKGFAGTHQVYPVRLA